MNWRVLLCIAAFCVAFAAAFLLVGCADDPELPYCSEIGCPPKPNDYCKIGSKCTCQPTPDVEPRACIYGEPVRSPQ